MEQQYLLTIDDEEIDVKRRNIKHLYLEVSHVDGRLKVSAPLSVSDEMLVAFVEDKQHWISKQRQNIRALQRQQALNEKKFVTGEHHFYRGKQYVLNLIQGKSPSSITLRDNRYLDFYVSEGASAHQCRKVLTEWYRSELKQLLPPLINKWQYQIGVEVKEWKVKKMKTRWGTCNIPAHRVWLNLELIKKPDTCLEYVVVHEMVHLLERSHNARFKAYMDRFMPDWRERKRLLND